MLTKVENISLKMRKLISIGFQSLKYFNLRKKIKIFIFSNKKKRLEAYLYLQYTLLVNNAIEVPDKYLVLYNLRKVFQVSKN